MKEFWNLTRACFAGIGGWLGHFLGGNDGLLIALIAFVAADYITGVMRTAVVFFYLSNEGVSLLENVTHLGLPVPVALRTVLLQLHDKEEEIKKNENEEEL